jgi:hypothetical protein
MYCNIFPLKNLDVLYLVCTVLYSIWGLFVCVIYSKMSKYALIKYSTYSIYLVL